VVTGIVTADGSSSSNGCGGGVVGAVVEFSSTPEAGVGEEIGAGPFKFSFVFRWAIHIVDIERLSVFPFWLTTNEHSSQVFRSKDHTDESMNGCWR
jgi:hypothetical protein